MSIQTGVKAVTVQVSAVVTMEDGSIVEYVTEELDVTDAHHGTRFEVGVESDVVEEDWSSTRRVIPTGVSWLTCNARLRLADPETGHLFTVIRNETP